MLEASVIPTLSTLAISIVRTPSSSWATRFGNSKSPERPEPFWAVRVLVLLVTGAVRTIMGLLRVRSGLREVPTLGRCDAAHRIDRSRRPRPGNDEHGLVGPGRCLGRKHRTRHADSELDELAAGDRPGAGPLQTESLVIGRYRRLRVLGAGNFGRVYLAHDADLDRLVAIKVPDPERLTGPEDAEAYLTEARMLAKLDHPNIVPVYDVGRTDDATCYVVSKYIEGTDLAARLKQGRPMVREACAMDGGDCRSASPCARVAGWSIGMSSLRTS